MAAHLAQIPLEAWERRTPVLDKVIREILRLAQPHTAMRRNMGPATYIGGTRVPSGAYVVYPFSDVHLDPQLYPDPWSFEPDRAECTAQYEYVGWGGGKRFLPLPSRLHVASCIVLTSRALVGRTTCLGQRLAKLQLKLVTALLLMTMDFALVDETGAEPHSLPRPNWNDTLTCKPPKGSCYLRFGCTSTDATKTPSQ